MHLPVPVPSAVPSHPPVAAPAPAPAHVLPPSFATRSGTAPVSLRPGAPFVAVSNTAHASGQDPPPPSFDAASSSASGGRNIADTTL